MSDNIAQLKKLAKLINTDKIVTSDEIEQIIAALVTVLANNKKSTDGITAQANLTMQQALSAVTTQLNQIRHENADKLAQANKDIQAKLNQTLQQAQTLIDEAKAAMPKDGEDAKPEDVVPLVMAQIKLPEEKAVILDGPEEILAKLNELPTGDDQLKIDASHIRNLPLGRGGLLHGGFRNMEVYDETTLITKAARVIKFVGSGVQATATADGKTVTVTVAGGGSSLTPVDEDASDSGDHTTFTISHTPIANTLLVINENTGQAVPAGAYTNTTTSIIFNQSQQVDDGTGKLVTPTFRARYFY